jgi:hypothetical protein
MALTRSQAKTILTRLGFRVNTSARYHQSLRDFQAGWNLGAQLKVDGVLGPKTSGALARSEKNRRDGKPTASAHFYFKEMRCHCLGKYSACRVINGEGKAGSGRHVLRRHFQSLEVLRGKFYTHGMTIVSGYRCPGHNKDVDGASTSQHLTGGGSDVSPVASTTAVKKLAVFGGIGYQGGTGKVRHVDNREVSGVNPTKGSRAHPTTWRY